MSQPTPSWRFIPLDVNDGFTNMAIDEAILVNRMKDAVPNTVRLYQWAPSTVSIGMHQSVKLEVDEAEIVQRGFQLVRRISGGGAVLHAKGREITYSVVARVKDLLRGNAISKAKVDAIYEIILRVIQRTVSQLSLSAASGVIHCPALLVDGKKISGNAQCIKGNYVLQHGTILLSVDSDEMYSVLRPPEGVTKGRMVRSVKAKVAGLEDYIETAISPRDFESKFFKSFSEIVGTVYVEGNLASGEADMVNGLKEKYASTEWRYKYP
jgi:lipoate-protein ligase A